MRLLGAETKAFARIQGRKQWLETLALITFKLPDDKFIMHVNAVIMLPVSLPLSLSP